MAGLSKIQNKIIGNRIKMKTQIIRKLDKSYFLLRTHDKIDHFLQPQVERIFHSSKNSMGRFLPPAKIIQEKGGRSVCYYLTKMQAKTLRPLKEITLPELNALKKAATDFLSPEKETTKYEKSLRRAFCLPDPELEPDSYFLWGTKRNPKLLILWGIEKVPGSSLPVFTTEKSGHLNNDNIISKLSKRVIRRTREWVGTTIFATIFAIGLSSVFFLKDTSPPEVMEVTSRNDPHTIWVKFDEGIAPETISEESFKIRNTAYVLVPSVNQKDKKLIQLTSSVPLEDEVDYFLDFGLKNKLSDLAGNLVSEKEIRDSERIREFRYEDLLPPQILEVEPLPPHSLIVRFNEAVSRRSAIRPSTFRLSNFRLIDAILDEESFKEVTLKFEETLVHNGSYLLEVNGLEDDSEFRNQLNDKVEFRYLDTFSPDLISVVNGENQSEVILHFDECLDPITSLDPKNYGIDGGLTIKHVVPFKEFDDPSLGKGSFSSVRLITTPVQPRKEYQVKIHSLGDRMNPPNYMDEQTSKFTYDGPLDRSPPFIRKVRGSGNILIIELSEILDHQKFDSFSQITVLDLKRNKEMKVGAVMSEVRGNSSLVKVSLVGTQFPGRLYRLSVKNCPDASGNETHLDTNYEARGIFRKPIALHQMDTTREGQSRIQFRLPPGVQWESMAIKNIEAYGISTTAGIPIEVDELEYESKNDGAQVSLNLKYPLEVGIYQFFLEGAKLMDGSLVDRAYRGDVKIGS